MTTIAYMDGVLAADTRACVHDLVSPSGMKKIYHPAEGEYWEVMGVKCLAAAFAGSSDGILHVIDMLKEGLTHKTRSPQDIEIAINVILVLENKSCYVYSAVTNSRTGRNSSVLIPFTPPVSCGSGQGFAYSMMAIGKSPEQAVKHAMKMDPYTGGEVMTWVCPEPPAVPSTRPVKETPPADTKDGKTPLSNITVDQLKEFIHETMDKRYQESAAQEEARRDAGPMKIKPAAA